MEAVIIRDQQEILSRLRNGEKLTANIAGTRYFDASLERFDNGLSVNYERVHMATLRSMLRNSLIVETFRFAGVAVFGEQEEASNAK